MLVLPAMQQVYDKVDFKLSFIGLYATTPLPSTTRMRLRFSLTKCIV